MSRTGGSLSFFLLPVPALAHKGHCRQLCPSSSVSVTSSPYLAPKRTNGQQQASRCGAVWQCLGFWSAISGVLGGVSAYLCDAAALCHLLIATDYVKACEGSNLAQCILDLVGIDRTEL